ncbi:MAG TPA: LysR family transcriptional regulator [Xanthobacteraceae bacterium]|nr:LysR family transcriptional regulator [Xanthobacteraceae bacterium]
MIAASSRRLSVFQCVVDAGGFNAAAMRLGIAQPSVGAHIKALETQVGQPLFRRQRGSRPQLTRAGETLYAYAVETLKRSAEASHLLADLRRAQAREIVVGAHRDIAAHFLPVHLAAFARHSPKTRVVTRIGTLEEVLALVRAGDVDLGLFLATAPVAGLHSEVLAHEPLAIVVAPGHPLVRLSAVGPEALDKLAFVSGLRGSRWAKMIEKALRRFGLTRCDVTMELQESSAVVRMVRHGGGGACLPLCTVAEEIGAGTLARLDLRDPLPSLELRCAWRTPLPEAAGDLVAHLRAAAKARA